MSHVLEHRTDGVVRCPACGGALQAGDGTIECRSCRRVQPASVVLGGGARGE